MTGLFDVKSYAVCVTIYEKIHPNLATQLDAMCEKWRADCLVSVQIVIIMLLRAQFPQTVITPTAQPQHHKL